MKAKLLFFVFVFFYNGCLPRCKHLHGTHCSQSHESPLTALIKTLVSGTGTEEGGGFY